MFMRWAQLGAISPVMEVGGARPERDAVGVRPAGDARAARRGRPPLRALPVHSTACSSAASPCCGRSATRYPDDPEAWRADLELLVGPDLLAAPVAGPGTTPSVYLPKGAWVDLYSGTTVRGGRSFTRETPLTEFPLYARAGAVVPFNLRTQTGSWWGLNEQTHPGRAGFLATNGATLALRGQPKDVQIFVPAPSRPRARHDRRPRRRAGRGTPARCRAP